MLETRNLTIRFGGHVAVDHVSCAFAPGTLTAIVGPNGAGKTTYFNLISGQLPASEGQVLLDDMDLTALPAPGSHYLLPFGARSRFLFKMDFAEADYLTRLRSGVKGHFSYRKVAWEMKEKMVALEPELGKLMEATPPWIEDPLTR